MISSVEGKKLLGLRTACDGGWPLYLRAQQGPGSDWPLGPQPALGLVTTSQESTSEHKDTTRATVSETILRRPDLARRKKHVSGQCTPLLDPHLGRRLPKPASEMQRPRLGPSLANRGGSSERGRAIREDEFLLLSAQYPCGSQANM